MPQSIRDGYRLGKFSSGASRPRPILIRIADVSGILSKRRNLTQPYSDMSPNQRLYESILLKERWNLIQSGVSRKYIRIRADCLYVRNKLHGRVCNSKFVHEASDPGATHLDNNPIVQHDHSPHHHVHTVPVLNHSTTSSVNDLSPLSPTHHNRLNASVTPTFSNNEAVVPQPNTDSSQS